MEKLHAGPWLRDQQGRQRRTIKIKGVQYHQWHHENGPVKPFGQQLTDAEDPTIPRYKPEQKIANSRPAAPPTHTGPGTKQLPTQHPAVRPADYGRHTSGTNTDYSRVAVTRSPHQTTPSVPYTLFPQDDDDLATPASAPTPSHYALSTAPGSDGQPSPLDYGRAEHRIYRTNDGSSLVSPEPAKSRESARSPSATRTYSGTIGPGESKAIEGAGLELSKTGHEFLKLKYTDYAACENFIKACPEILQEDHNLFIQEAVRAYREGKASQARVCIQQSLILQMCSGLSEIEIRRLFDRLLSKDKKNKVLAQFFEEFDKISGHVKNVAERELEKANLRRKIARTRDGTLVYVGENGDILGPATTRHPSETYASRSTDVMSDEFSKLKVSRSAPNPSQLVDQGARSKSSNPPQIERSDSARRSTLSSVDENGSTYAPSIVPEFRGTPPEREQLDERYQKRFDAKKFFVIGRVFALLWHESAGESKPGNRPNPDLSDYKYVTRGHLGQNVFSHIRRMVVVKERHGYCWCIPINTYKGKGVAKHGLSRQEREAHAIIHESGLQPWSHPDEHNMMIKLPIAVKMAKADQKLDEMSRLNFAKVHTVEWNVKVMNVGRVAEKSMVYFTTYWNNESAA